MIIYKIDSHTVADTFNLAELLVKNFLLPKQNFVDGALIIYLEGNLGSGKTTFVRGMLASLGFLGSVKSPTYTIVETYDNLVVPFYHFDLYRLNAPKELELIGIRDYLEEQAICCFEWPDKGANYIPSANYVVKLDILAEDQRKIIITKVN